MTATPRIFGDNAKATAERDNVALYDMNNESQFGETSTSCRSPSR